MRKIMVVIGEKYPYEILVNIPLGKGSVDFIIDVLKKNLK